MRLYRVCLLLLWIAVVWPLPAAALICCYLSSFIKVKVTDISAELSFWIILSAGLLTIFVAAVIAVASKLFKRRAVTAFENLHDPLVEDNRAAVQLDCVGCIKAASLLPFVLTIAILGSLLYQAVMRKETVERVFFGLMILFIVITTAAITVVIFSTYRDAKVVRLTSMPNRIQPAANEPDQGIQMDRLDQAEPDLEQEELE